MNKFNVVCPGCKGMYLHKIVEGFSKLLHNGPLRGPACIQSIDYVYYNDCEHCCPERFSDCPECEDKRIGLPTNTKCRSNE